MTDSEAGEADWHSPLYDSYVSSGHSAPSTDNPDTAFSSRSPWIRAIVRRHLPQDRGVRILDLGCGHGAFLYVLRDLGFRDVSGVDASPEQVEAAGRLGVKGVRLGDALKHARSLERGSVDVVLTIDLLEHLDGERLLALAREVRRICRADGRWILHVPNGEGIFGAGVCYGDLTHRRAFTPSSVRQLCRTAGFDRVDIHADPPVVHGAVSLARRILWSLAVLPVRLVFAAETGRLDPVLTQNLTAVVRP